MYSTEGEDIVTSSAIQRIRNNCLTSAIDYVIHIIYYQLAKENGQKIVKSYVFIKVVGYLLQSQRGPKASFV